MDLVRLVTGSRAEESHLIVSCDENSHHTSWGSTNTKSRCQSLCNYIMVKGLDIMNRGNRLTFVISNKHEVVGIKIATFYIGNFIKNWLVSEEVTCSEHRHIQFTVTGIAPSVEVYHISRRPDWNSF
jgi:hypothetical protein